MVVVVIEGQIVQKELIDSKYRKGGIGQLLD